MTAEFIVALHAMEFLNHNQRPFSSEAIAENVCTNPARVRKVMHKLKAAGLVESRPGAEGGYAFLGEADQVTLLQIFEAVGNKIIKVSWRSGDGEMDCPIATGMAPVVDEIFKVCETACRDRLSAMTVAEIDHRLFAPAVQKGAEHEDDI